MERVVDRSDAHRAGWDRGRKLLSVTKLSAGGAIIAASLVGLIAGLAGRSTSDFTDSMVALVGGVATFVVLVRTFHIFDAHE